MVYCKTVETSVSHHETRALNGLSQYIRLRICKCVF